MKTLLCQINTTPNDFDGNCQQIVNGFREGWRRNADLIVFPELAIPGYLCKDMMFRRGFVEENLKHLNALISHIPLDYNPYIVLGYIDKNYSGEGKPFRNMAAVIKNGHIIATYQKQLLPFYDVFDEGRYFQPGNERTVVEICGKKWGICICEDLWNDKGIDDYNYKFNPVEERAEKKVGKAFPFFDDKEQYYRMIRVINNNEFKRRQAAPGIKITPVAFGVGRRLPIVKG